MQHADMCKHSSPREPSTAREPVLPVVKMKFRKPTSKEDSLRLQMSDGCLLKTLRTVGAMNERRIEEMGLRTGPATITSSLLRVGSERRLGSPCPWDHHQHPAPKRALSLRGRDVFVQDVLPTTAQRYDGPLQNWKIFASQRHPWSPRIGSSLRSISSNPLCVWNPRTRTSRHSHFRIETPFTAAQHFAYFQQQLRSLSVSHQHYTLHGLRVALPIIGFSIATYHYYDAEVGGPLKGPSRDTFKKARFYFTNTGSPRKLRTVSALSQISQLVSLQNLTTERHATISHNHELCPLRLASQSEHFPYLQVTWDE